MKLFYCLLKPLFFNNRVQPCCLTMSFSNFKPIYSLALPDIGDVMVGTGGCRKVRKKMPLNVLLNKWSTQMDDKLFEQLIQSAEQMVAIEQGQCAPAAVYAHEHPDPRQVRQRLQQTQAQFAQTIGVSTSLVQSWEQQRRFPDGASLKILRVLDKQPELATLFQSA